MKDCPNCKLINPDSALRCDCGYDFPTGNLERSYLTAKDKKLAGGALGGLLLVYLLFRLTLIGTAAKIDPQIKVLLLLAIITFGILAFRSGSSRKTPR